MREKYIKKEWITLEQKQKYKFQQDNKKAHPKPHRKNVVFAMPPQPIHWGTKRNLSLSLSISLDELRYNKM